MKQTISRFLTLTLAMILVLSFTVFASAESLTPAEAGMAEPGSIYSDIVAGIDLSSVIVDDEGTRFSSVMSDGTVVRFEGSNITVTEEGLTLHPDATLVSLESVGTIYLYQATFKDGLESPVAEQWFDVGFGYTDSPDHLIMERASNVYGESFAGVHAVVWNNGLTLDIAEIQPNFVYFKSSGGNTADATLTSLIIGYNPALKYTDISVPRQVLPDHFWRFDEFFAVQEPAPADEPVAEPSYEEPAHEEPAADPVEEPAGQESVSVDENDPYALSAAKMAEPGALISDIVAGIDRNSITTDGALTSFYSVMSDGTAILFEGQDITITDEGIVFGNTSRITMLDAVGKIYNYQLHIKDGEEAPASQQWMCVDYGYTLDAEKTSVERGDDLRTLPGLATEAYFWNTREPTVTSFFEPNFLCVYALGANTDSVTLTSLTIGYQALEKYTAPEEIRVIVPDNFLLGYTPSADNGDVITSANGNGAEPVGSEEDQAALHQPAQEAPAESYAQKKLAEAGVLHSDIVAGIDHGSVKTKGDSTFFSAVMSDGTVVRFEGRNIAISDEGIVMQVDSQLTSLDAVGKIYEYSATVKDQDTSPIADQWLGINYAYTFSAEKISVDSADDVYTSGIGGLSVRHWTAEYTLDTAIYSPNFVSINSANYNTEDFTLTSLTIGYNPDSKVTAITAAELDVSQYGYYVDGELYAASKEDKANAANREYEFYLVLKPETQDEAGVNDTDRWLRFLPKAFYTTGDLKDANGNVLDKSSARVHAGTTLDVNIGDYTVSVKLPMATLYTGLQTLKEARPYSTLSSTGSQHTLVIPVVWADQTDLVSDELQATYQKALGRMIDECGNPVGDFSNTEDEVFSLSEYFDIASYGQLEISSFMTDWYYTDKTFADDYEFVFPEIDFADEVLQWVKAVYPTLDWSQFDQDGDGVVDSIVLISVGLSQNESYAPASFGGAVHSTGNDFGKLAGTPEDPQANTFLTVNHAYLADGDTAALIHEYSHNFGLNDYYDGSGNGINAVGGYDMQGNSIGDWNAYSKMAVGWMNPQVVTGLTSGESVELTIASSALKGDVIVLPPAGTDYTGPFSEYVMIDLLSPDGVNTYDAAEYQLEDTVGVRISHVNASMKRMTESDTVSVGFMEDNGNVVGMELYDNNYDADRGFYNLEVIQAGKKNTFSSLENIYPYLRPKDLFYAGDTFTAEAYDQFFYQGLLDNGTPLGYTVTILNIGTDADGLPTATIRITAE